MTLSEAKTFLEERINPNMVDTILNAAIEEGEKMNIICATFSKDENDEFVCDKTYEELEEAVKNKKVVYGYYKFKSGNQTWTYYYSNIIHRQSLGTSVLSFIRQDGYGFTINSMGTITEITP